MASVSSIKSMRICGPEAEICSVNPSPSNPHVVIIGGSYAGIAALTALLALKDGRKIPLESYCDIKHLRAVPRIPDLKISVIDERDGFFHTVGTPLAHVSQDQVDHMWRKYSEIPILKRKDVIFIQGSCSAIGSDGHKIIYLDSHSNKRSICCDYLLVTTGRRRKWPTVPQARNKDAYVKEAKTHIDSIKLAQKLGTVVIGGGAVGVEFAGKIKKCYPSTPVTLIHSRGFLLSNEPLPNEFKSLALQLLREQGVEVILGERPAPVKQSDQLYRIPLSDGTCIFANHIIWAATQAIPSTGFLPPSTLGDDGSINVDLNQRVVGDLTLFGHVFAAGDAASLSRIKLGGSAMVTGCVAAMNIYSLLCAQKLGQNHVQLAACSPYYLQPKMSLAVGSNIACWSGNGTRVLHGLELAEQCFGNDLGWTRLLASLGLEDCV